MGVYDVTLMNEIIVLYLANFALTRALEHFPTGAFSFPSILRCF